MADTAQMWQPVAEALEKSAKAFDRLVKPHAMRLLRGEFEIVESVTQSRVAQLLDVLAGIDLWFFDTERGVMGVANRVQWGDKSWRTFTIRKSRDSGARTEFEKRCEAIQGGWLYPQLTLQAYVTRDRQRLLSFAIAYTRDIIALLERGEGEVRKTGSAQHGQAEFYVLGWDTLREHNCKLLEYVPEGALQGLHENAKYRRKPN